MSKKKSKKGDKKPASDDESIPNKTAIQTVYENFLNAKSLTLSQQINIVSKLGLSNYSLYDSIIIEIITDFLQFAKTIQLNANQIRPLYYAVQTLLYKIMNDEDGSLDGFTRDFNQRVSSQIGKEIKEPSDEPSNQSSTECICTKQSESILQFIQQRLFSQYALYRVALFDNNPSNIRYKEFKKSFAIGDMVRFQSKECLFKIEQFRSNDVVLSCLHDDFKSFEVNEKEKIDQMGANETIKYNVSRDQLLFISFVSRPKSEEQQTQITEHETAALQKEEDEINNDENTDTTKDKEEEHVVTEDASNENDTKEVKMNVAVNDRKTLIDIIVHKKMEEKLKSMQEKFDQELEEYKQQIEKLQNTQQTNAL